jgi:xylulokinase
MSAYVIAYDIGTTGVKTCLFEISDAISLVESASADYPLYVLDGGVVEQDPELWWQAMCRTTKHIFEHVSIPQSSIEGISFCAQMQSLVLVDRDGLPVRRAMSYMDSRAAEEIKKGIMSGVKIAGLNARKLLRSIAVTGAVSASVKDPVWKYNWVKNHEPDVYSKVFKWLDVKDFLVYKACGRFVMSEDSAFATLLFDTRKGKKGFSREICDRSESVV